MLFNEFGDRNVWRYGQFKDFQAPVLFSSGFKALNLGEKKFKYFQGCVGILHNKPISVKQTKYKHSALLCSVYITVWNTISTSVVYVLQSCPNKLGTVPVTDCWQWRHSAQQCT